VDSSPAAAAWRQVWAFVSDLLAAESLSRFGPPPVGRASTVLVADGEIAADVELKLASWVERADLVTRGAAWAAEHRLVLPA
jgi:hypothetical protein